MTTRIWIDWNNCTTISIRVYDADTGKLLDKIAKMVLEVDAIRSRVIAEVTLTISGKTETYEVWPQPRVPPSVKNVDDMSDDEVRKLVKKVMNEKCPTCGGKGWVADFQSRIDCPDCTP